MKTKENRRVVPVHGKENSLNMEDFRIVNVINFNVETKRPPLLSYHTHTSSERDTGRVDGRSG